MTDIRQQLQTSLGTAYTLVRELGGGGSEGGTGERRRKRALARACRPLDRWREFHLIAIHILNLRPACKARTFGP